MKYLLIFVLVFLVAWRWRSSRATQHLQKAKKKAAAQAVPVDMVSCNQCGVHVPASDATRGARGSYCSPAHLNLAEH